MTLRQNRRGLAAPFALPLGFALLYAVGVVAAVLGGRLPASGVLIACAVVTGAVSFVAVPISALPLALIGWLTAIGFSRPPYAQLRPAGPLSAHAAIAIAASALAGAGVGWLYRWCAGRFTLVGMGAPTGARPSDPARAAGHGHTGQPAAGLLTAPRVEPGKGASLAR